MAVAWGSVSIRRISTDLGNGRRFVYVSATPDGAWLIGTQRSHRMNDPNDRPVAVLLSVATHDVVPMAPLADQASQILTASSDGRWVVWTEADDPSVYDWRMVAYDTETRSSKVIGRAPVAGGKPIQGPAPWPKVSAGRVVWGQATGSLDPNHLDRAVVSLRELSTGKTITLGTNAMGPAFSWPWVAWVTGKGSGYVTIEDLLTGMHTSVQAQPSRLGLFGSSLVLDDGLHFASISVVDDAVHPEARTIARAASAADALQWPSLNDRIVAWSQDSVTQVYDRAEHKLVALGDYPKPNWVDVYSSVLIWTAMPASQIDAMSQGLAPEPDLYLVDTSTLPVKP